MNKGFEELNLIGIRGIAAFWFRLLLFGLSLAVAIFSIFWIVRTVDKIWISSIDGKILTANVFLTLTSIGSFVFLLLCRLSIKFIYSVQFTHHVFAILSLIGQIICCVLISLSNSSHAETYLKSIEDYCKRNPSNKAVTKFILNNPSSYSRFRYVAKRSTDLYSSISSFFAIWFGSTILYLICSNKLPDVPPEKLSLLHNQQEQPQIQHLSDPEKNHKNGNSIPDNNQPWVQNPDEESNSNIDNGQDEINITTNSNTNQLLNQNESQRSNLNESQRSNLNESQRSNLNESQNPSHSNTGWVMSQENDTSNNNNPDWAISHGAGQHLDQNYGSYTYEEES